MRRYDCRGCLRVSCREIDDQDSRQITIYLQHHEAHTPYYDVAMPDDAASLIREHLEWLTPSAMVSKVQASFPAVTATQVHSAWSVMSETLWKRDDLQLPSAEILLREYSGEAEVFNLAKVDGVEQLAWGVKRVSDRLRGKVVEVGIDATCMLSGFCMSSRD